MKKLLFILAVIIATGCNKQCNTYSVADGNNCISYAERIDGQWNSTGNGNCSNGIGFGSAVNLTSIADNIVRFDSQIQLVFSNSTTASGGPWTFTAGNQTWTTRIQAIYIPATSNQTNHLGQQIPNTGLPEQLIWKVWRNENTSSASYCTLTLVR